MCQKLSKLVDTWRTSDKNNLHSFFETRCSYISKRIRSIRHHYAVSSNWTKLIVVGNSLFAIIAKHFKLPSEKKTSTHNSDHYARLREYTFIFFCNRSQASNPALLGLRFHGLTLNFGYTSYSCAAVAETNGHENVGHETSSEATNVWGGWIHWVDLALLLCSMLLLRFDECRRSEQSGLNSPAWAHTKQSNRGV